MLTRLKPWQTVLLFIPFFVSFVISKINAPVISNFNDTYQVSNLLSTFNILLLICCQSYLLLKFNSLAIKRVTLFSINAVIPVISTAVWLSLELYLTIVSPLKSTGEVKDVVDFGILRNKQLIAALLLLHAAVTFFIVNNYYVTWKIKKITNPSTQAAFTHNYLQPMRLIVKSSTAIFVVSILLDILYNLVIRFI